MSRTPNQASGIVGAFLDSAAAKTLYYLLFALQHRGQRSAGIVTSDNQKLHIKSDHGLVNHVLTEASLANLQGKLGIGSVSNNATHAGTFSNQLMSVTGSNGDFAVAHNGNLINGNTLRERLSSQGIEFSTKTDAEIIAQLLANTSTPNWTDRFRIVLSQLVGSYSLTILTPNTLFAVRDPLGIRPLCIGQVGNGWLVASETCALDHLDASAIREIEAGEVVQIDQNGATSFFPLGKNVSAAANCALEVISSSRPDSRYNNSSIWSTRVSLGQRLAKEYPIEADVVIGIPDAGTPAAIGYAQQLHFPFREGLVKNRYVDRTLVDTGERLRNAGAVLKFNALGEVLEGQVVVLVDDRIEVGGTTAEVVTALRRKGAREIHLRITSPPIYNRCFHGVGLGIGNELIAHEKTIQEILKFIGADTIGFLSIKGLLQVMGLSENRVCLACFTGNYPTPVQGQLALEVSRQPVAPKLVLV